MRKTRRHSVAGRVLVEQFAATTGRKIAGIERASLELLAGYEWPGNIRELQNVVERAVILCEGGELSLDPTWIRPQMRGHSTHSAPFVATVLCQEKSLIEAALHETVGRIAVTNGGAAKLGIPVRPSKRRSSGWKSTSINLSN